MSIEVEGVILNEVVRGGASPPSDSDSESESETESESENEPESESESEPVTSTSSVTTVSAAFSAEAFFAATYRSTFSAHAFLQMSIAPTLLMEASASGCRLPRASRAALPAPRGAAAQQRCRRWALYVPPTKCASAARGVIKATPPGRTGVWTESHSSRSMAFHTNFPRWQRSTPPTMGYTGLWSNRDKIHITFVAPHTQ